MKKKLLVGAAAYLIILLVAAIFYLLAGKSNYLLYKEDLKLVQEKTNNESNNANANNTSSSDTSSNNLDNSTNPNSEGSSIVADTNNVTPEKPANIDANNVAVNTDRKEETYNNVNFIKNLSKGYKGEDVKKLQYLLKKKNLYTAQIDGVFGNATHEAVISFQKSQKLSVDGIAGQNTFKKLLQ